MLKSVLGVVLGMTAFGAWAVVSAIQPGPDIEAAVFAFAISALAGAVSVSFLRFLSGLALGTACFTLWTAITEKGIHLIARLMLPVLFGWTLLVACLGFALGILIAHGLEAVTGRPEQH